MGVIQGDCGSEQGSGTVPAGTGFRRVTDGVEEAVAALPVVDEVANAAPVDSPAFTGTVTLPVALTGFLRADAGVVSTAVPPSGGSPPTGTGFRHIAGGTEDAAAKLVDTADINASQVTNAKLAQMAANTVKANATAGAADPADLAVGANTVVGRVAGNVVAAALVDAQVDAAAAIALSKLATQAANTICANTTGGAAVPAAVGVAGILGMLGAFAGVTIQQFTSSGTYTPTSGMKFCVVIGTGGGGGGGGSDATNATSPGDAAAGGGGGAGGTALEVYSAATIGVSKAVTVGAAGAAGAVGATGGTGGIGVAGYLLVIEFT